VSSFVVVEPQQIADSVQLLIPFSCTYCSSRYAATGLASEKETPAMTIPQMFSKAVAKHANKIALAVENIPFALAKGEKPPASIPRENWSTWTYQEYYDECRVVGKSLLRVGLMPKNSVCIFGFNSPEWVMAAMACTLAGGCSAGIYPSDTVDQVVYKAKHSGAVVAFVESRKKAKYFLDHASQLPMLKGIVLHIPTFQTLSRASLSISSNFSA
jgi:long-subunit acyl-CoA synthetase (AMP-forming)